MRIPLQILGYECKTQSMPNKTMRLAITCIVHEIVMTKIGASGAAFAKNVGLVQKDYNKI